MSELEELKLYSMPEMEKLMGTDRHNISRYIKAGLLKSRIIGHGWKCSGKEIAAFYELTAGKDISNADRIILAGQQARKNAAPGRAYRK